MLAAATGRRGEALGASETVGATERPTAHRSLLTFAVRNDEVEVGIGDQLQHAEGWAQGNDLVS
jgi:hypothetical protein